jgi:SSS family solute:Na+ symporter/sodium/proline symporter
MPAEELLSFALAFGLSIAVSPYEISRVYAMKSDSTVAPAVKASLLIQAFIAVCILVLGLVAAVTVPGLDNPDAAVSELIRSQLGPAASWLLFCGIIAAILSTIDSVLLVSASAVAYDLYGMVLKDGREGSRTGSSYTGWTAAWSFGNPPSGDRHTLRVARLGTVVAAVVPLFLALNRGLLGDLVQTVVALFGALIAGTLFAPVFLGIQWDGATTRGAVAGVLVGFSTVVAWHLLWTTYEVVPGALGLLPPTAVGVGCSTAVLVFVSLLE